MEQETDDLTSGGRDDADPMKTQSYEARETSWNNHGHLGESR
jgi:hypothetical protein